MARKKFCVGIDIGSSSIKLCQLKQTKTGMVLKHYGCISLPQESIAAGTLVNPNPIIDAIKELIATHKIRSKQVAISVSGHSVITKKISMPQMSPAELEQNIRWEAEQFIPFDISDVYMDYQVITQSSRQQGNMEIALVAVKKEIIDVYTRILAQAGLVPIICDADSFALETMFRNNYDMPQGKTIALIDMGATKTNINIFKNGVSNFTRDLTIGGIQFTNEIQKQLGVSREEAEILKVSCFSKNMNRDQNAPAEVLKSIRNIGSMVASEIQRSFDFYASTNSDNSPEHIFLTGGSSILPPLEEILKTRLRVNLTQLNPFNRIQTEMHDPNYILSQISCASVAIGLALRHQGDC